MNIVQLEQELSQHPLKSIYLLCGTEQYFIGQACTKIVTAAFGHNADSEHDKVTFDAQSTAADEIINTANTYPFLTTKQVIVIKNFDASFSAKSEAAVKSNISVYESYFADPAEFTVLILVAEKMDKRLKITKTAIQKGYYYEFPQLKEYEIPKMIKHELKSRYGKSIDDDGALLLSEFVGVRLDSLEMELEKLSLYVGKKHSITADDIAHMVGNTALVDNFKMIDLLAMKDGKNALYMLLHLLHQHQEPPERLIGLLKWQFKRLYTAKKALKNGTPFNSIVAEYRIFPTHQGKFKSQLDNFSLSTLRKIYFLLYRIDRMSKSTGLKAQFLLEQFFCSIVLG